MISTIVRLVSKILGLTFAAVVALPSLLPFGIWMIDPPICLHIE